MAKEGLGGMLKGLASGTGVFGNKIGPTGVLGGLVGGNGDGQAKTNPGMKMFGMEEGPNGVEGGTTFMDRFKSQMLAQLMGGFGGQR